MYIGEKLSKEIKNWKQGDFVYIRAGTGKGKTYFVNNQLRTFALNQTKRILFLCPRVSLKEDVENNIDKILQNVHSVTYQKILHDYKKGELMLGEYDYIVMDEFATFINDSTFNPEVEDIFNIIMKLNKVKIFMAADGDLYIDEIADLYNVNFKKYLFDKSPYFMYDVFNRVNKTYSYKTDTTIENKISEILENTDDKILCFINNNESIGELYSQFEDEAMIYVSEGSPHRKKMNMYKNEKMFKEKKFDDRILFATSAIISGVSLIDRDIKHIVIDEKNVHSIYQMLSRKRLIDKNDTFDLYIKDVSIQSINGILRGINNGLETVHEFKYNKERFLLQRNRNRQDNKLIYFDEKTGEIKLNNIRTIVLKSQKEMYEHFKDGGFIANIEGNLNLFIDELEEVEGMKKFNDNIDSFVGKKLYKPEQKKLKELLLDCGFNSRTIGFNTINGFLVDKGLSYTLVQGKVKSYRENGVVKTPPSYWVLIEIEDKYK